jgi:hypothetical protein
MGHYAKVLNDQVIQVITAEPDFFDSFVDTSPGEWIQCSYNTINGVHVRGGTPLRGNYPGVGYTYDRTHDVFYEPKPFPSWTLNTSTWAWESPAGPIPDTVSTGTAIFAYIWDEPTTSWKLDIPQSYPNDGKIYYYNPETKQWQEGVSSSSVPKPAPEPGFEFAFDGLTSSWIKHPI